MYSVYANLYQAKLKKVRYTNRGLNFRWLLDKIDKDTQFIIIANPNSPLGDYYSFDQIKILEYAKVSYLQKKLLFKSDNF